MRTQIDMKTYKKRNQYLWFKNYASSAYGFDVEMDVSQIVKISKEKKESFFSYFLYAVMKGVNAIEEMRMRIVDGKPYLYDYIHPTFTVMTKEGVYQNCGFEMMDDFSSFYQKAEAVIQEVKTLPVSDELDRFPICQTPNVVFATCIPILDFKGMTHPLPTSNQESLSIPRICWGKYHQVGENSYRVMLNITVSHAFVDGFPLAHCFEKIQETLNKAEIWTK